MGRLGMWTWTLCVLLGWMCVDHAVARPQYMVAIPSVLEVGADAKTCVSLLQPNETLTMTVTLVSEDTNSVLLQKTSGDEFHDCVQFKVPLAKNNEVHKLEVEVRGATFYSKEVRKVMTRVYEPMTFVQTDKPIYLPGQTVHFRVVTLDAMFRPVSQQYNVIEIEDVNGNRIGQWLNETSDGKILQRSFVLNAEAREGEYRVTVTIDQEKLYHFFKVEKYVLPKFDVKIEAPDEVSVKQEEIKAEICAKYTYGQPVPGNVRFQMCRPLSYNIPLSPDEADILLPASRCHEEIKPTDKTGCAAFTIKMSTFQRFDPKVLRDALDLKVKVEEEGTGVSHPQEKRISITYKVGKFSFIETAKIYEKGSNLEGKIKAVYHDNTPIPDFPVYLFKGETWEAHRLQNLTTDSNGIATFTLDTTNFSDDISLKVSNKPTLEYHGYRMEYYETGTHMLSMVQDSTPDSVSVSSLTLKTKDGPLPCDSEQDFTVQYSVVGEAQGSADIFYLVLSKGAIVMQGNEHIEIEDKPVTQGEMSFKMTVTPDMSPEIQIVVYTVLPSENVIAQKAEFSTEKCFSHKVAVEFSPPSAVPGEAVTMQVTAQPDSLCGLSAVDQSVLIKEPGKTLSVEKIMDLLPVKKLTNIPYQVEDQVECLPVRPRRYILPHPDRDGLGDAFKVFESLGLKMATNLFIREPTCLKFRGKEYHHGHYVMRYHSVPHLNRMTVQYGMASPGVGSAPRGGALDLAPIETARSFFPETWIWDLVEVGDSGRKDVSYTAPDTITTWETEAFCMSPQGFGLAPRKEIRVFQPFFIDLTLPYSIVRGEHFELKATTFNYLSSCIMVTVSPEPSSDYTLTPLSGDQYTSCLCGNERKTLSWTMAPTVLGVMNISVTAEALASQASCDNEVVSVPDRGRIDKVTRSLIVKAEGTEVSKSYNWLLCPKDQTLTEEIDIQLPENVIDGSARASVSVLGDILGRALQNLDGLLQMPYGCGEQNMALLAPNIYILQYLKNTEQLTKAILEKATNFLNSGYQRQLNYKHGNGAYSTFGVGDGNTWLTAFVLRSFAKAQSFIFIDSEKILQSRAWLERKQQKNGCFQKSGKLFNNRMKGGVSDEVTLTAYITAAYLEMDSNAKSPVVESSLSCLKESMGDLSNTYTTALMAYVFTLAGDMETRALLLNHLDTVASNQGGFLRWSQTAADTSASLSVEISSYVLLAKLSAQPSAEDLGYATRIVRWLTGQQNYYGGFSSTQDTVVALQALALYSTLVFSRDGASQVTVSAPGNKLVFDVNQDNKLLYQEASLKDVAGRYNMEVKGSACASMQISVHYNIPTPSTVTTLRVEVEPEADCSDNTQKPRVTLKLKSLYSGKESSTNMVILDIKMLSGFVPDTESLKNLKAAVLVDRVEEKEDHVLVYMQELMKDLPVSHSLQLVQQVPVQNLKPAVIKIYDYYQPSDQAETEYTFPCPAA